ncbi:MAG: hypothetical protein WCB53_11905 [Terriglobales bacterium]
MGPQTQRVAIRDGNRFTENYLGVMFVGGPDTLEPGDTADVKLALMYFPEYPYEEVQPGATFTVREGSLVVGYGVIQSRGLESFPLPLPNRRMERSFDIEQLDVNRLLEQWRWLSADPMTLVARNGFGDMFLRTTKGKILWLNVADGTLTEIAESESVFEHSLAEPAKRELWFAEPQLAALAEHGLKPNDLQCVGFKTPLVFAESVNAPNNAYVADLYEQVSFLGDLHRQIADSPNGGKVRLKVGQPPNEA